MIKGILHRRVNIDNLRMKFSERGNKEIAWLNRKGVLFSVDVLDNSFMLNRMIWQKLIRLMILNKMRALGFIRIQNKEGRRGRVCSGLELRACRCPLPN